MATIRGMVAATRDGFAADTGCAVGCPDPFDDADHGWPGFIAAI